MGRLLPEPTDREARVKADIISPRYPYYKDRNKGKERDGEHVGFSIVPLRAPGVKTRLFETSTDKHDQLLLPTSEGPAHGGSKGKSKIEFRTEFRPHSPQARNDTWLYDDDLPPEKKKKGALTIAELDRQLRLLEIQARAAEMGGPPLTATSLERCSRTLDRASGVGRLQQSVLGLVTWNVNGLLPCIKRSRNSQK